ncbi:trypsin-like peptidase domain-containing protein [Neobacillus sp. PS3-34]|uniref:trypsin-like peptidase domain-containing protein n=1 Tax=Neobacillus sp. PS3-34 TaxID=3070678 RepID=UPI0027E16BA6|nr:trypsin-like peptidase domain-containing protein [Neobacillus sp. PS3-34]WML46823.1 trypsin-like peptidase domain-containing protein [Neobacillus sp. PS3-34]
MKKFNFAILIVFILSAVMNFGSNTVFAATQTIKMLEPKVTILTGASKTLKLKVTNVDLKKVKWKSSAPAVVSVDSKGTIKGVTKGTSNVTAYVPSTKITATAIITVNQKPLDAKAAFAKINPSVVYIEALDKDKKSISSGSGVIVRKDGVIATNFHVIADVTEIYSVNIRLANGKVYNTTKVLGYDVSKDLAVLKVDGVQSLPAVTIGNSDKVKTGDKVFALGSPLGKQNSITEGIVSNITTTKSGFKYLVFTAPISHGNSGGALINSYGELIGINEATFTDGQNMNVAIPVNYYTKMNLSHPKTILQVNHEVYVAVEGVGNTNETEDNDDFDTANEVTFAEGGLSGALKDANDFDVFYFLVTSNSTIELSGATIDAALSKDFGFSIFDEDGEEIEYADPEYQAETGKYVCKLKQELAPGYYHIGIYAIDDTTLPYSNSAYSVEYKITKK